MTQGQTRSGDPSPFLLFAVIVVAALAVMTSCNLQRTQYQLERTRQLLQEHRQLQQARQMSEQLARSRRLQRERRMEFNKAKGEPDVDLAKGDRL